MPREKINNRDGDDIRVEVQWERDGGVQVSTAVDDGSDAVTSAEAAGFTFRGFGCGLNESATDRLIKCLQKARRQAFGEPPLTCATIEIIEPGRATDDTLGGSMIMPREVRINGQRLVTMKDSVKVHKIESPKGADCAQVTFTLAARRVTIAAEGDL